VDEERFRPELTGIYYEPFIIFVRIRKFSKKEK